MSINFIDLLVVLIFRLFSFWFEGCLAYPDRTVLNFWILAASLNLSCQNPQPRTTTVIISYPNPPLPSPTHHPRPLRPLPTSNNPINCSVLLPAPSPNPLHLSLKKTMPPPNPPKRRNSWCKVQEIVLGGGLPFAAADPTHSPSPNEISPRGFVPTGKRRGSKGNIIEGNPGLNVVPLDLKPVAPLEVSNVVCDSPSPRASRNQKQMVPELRFGVEVSVPIEYKFM